MCFKSGAFRIINEGFIGKKLRWGNVPQIFGAPSAKTTGQILKGIYSICIQSLVAISHCREVGDGTFRSLLSVMLSRLGLNQNTALKYTHSKSYIVAIY